MRWRNRRNDYDRADRLDATLDARPVPLPSLTANPIEPTVDVARLIDRLNNHDVEPEPSAAFVRSLENTLMQHTYRVSRTQPTISDPEQTSPMFAKVQATLPYRPAGLRRSASHTLSWFATAAILALLAASVIAAYLVSPRGGNDESNRLAALQESTPAPSESSDEVTPLVVPCKVAPRDFGQVLSLLEWRSPAGSGDLTGGVPPQAPNSVTREVAGQIHLPDGAPVAAEEIEAATATFGEYWGCISEQNTYGQLALLTDDGVVRLYYPYGGANNRLIAELNDPPKDPDTIERYETGEPTPYTLFGFRMLDDGRIAAYLGRSDAIPLLGGGTPVPGSTAGYIVFAEGGGRWLIDEYVTTMG